MVTGYCPSGKGGIVVEVTTERENNNGERKQMFHLGIRADCSAFLLSLALEFSKRLTPVLQEQFLFFVILCNSLHSSFPPV